MAIKTKNSSAVVETQIIFNRNKHTWTSTAKPRFWIWFILAITITKIKIKSQILNLHTQFHL